MTMWHSLRSVGVFTVACVTLVAMQSQRQDAAGGASGGQDPTQVAAPGRGGQRGGGRGRGDAPTVGPGNLVTGVWGENATAVDSRGWG